MSTNPSDKHTSMFLERSVTHRRSVSPMRIVVWIIVLLIFAFIAWATLARVPEVARTRGQVIPLGKVLNIQSLEGGQIVSLLVSEGQTVEKGQPLVRFEPLKTATDVNQLASRTAAIELDAERLRAFVEGGEPNFGSYQEKYPKFADQQRKLLRAQRAELDAEISVLSNQLIQKQKAVEAINRQLPVVRKQIRSSREIAQTYEKLSKQKIASRLELLNAQQRESEFRKEAEELEGMKKVLTNELIEIAEKKKSLRHNRIKAAEDERSELLAELSETSSRLSERRTSLDKLLMVSPVDGIIKALPFSSPGAVVKPGETLAEIVPLNVALVIEVHISPRDIGFVHVGQEARVRIDTFDYSRYGALEATLTKVSPTTFTGPKGEIFYKGEVTPKASVIGEGSATGTLLPGMTASADIVTGHKTVFQYLLKPVFTVANQGFQER